MSKMQQYGPMCDKWIAAMCQPVVYRLTPDSRPTTPIYLTKPELIDRGWWDDLPEILRKGEVCSNQRLPGQDLTVDVVEQVPMISPFVEHSTNTMMVKSVSVKIPSFGLSSFGYDIRLGRNFKVFKKKDDYIHDCLFGYEPDHVEDVNDVDSIVIEPGSMVLGVSVENVNMPQDVVAICMAKSTLARKGIEAKVTPLEPGWSGYITLEIANDTPNPIRIYSGMGIMQLMFFKGERPKTTYGDRNGKYMNQPYEPVLAKL
jgi:dCTP deaminase